MADAKKCDRCWQYYEVYGEPTAAEARITVANTNAVDLMMLPKYGSEKLIKRFELCPSCARFAVTLLTTPPGTPAKR